MKILDRIFYCMVLFVLPMILLGMSRIVDKTTYPRFINRGAIRPVGNIRFVVRHHSATTGGNAQTFANHWLGVLNWWGLGYHEVILRDGTVQVIKPPNRIANGVKNHNHNTYHICMVGSSNFTPEQERAFNERAAYNLMRFGLGVDALRGHNEFSGHASNICPGINMNTIRNNVRPFMRVGAEVSYRSHIQGIGWQGNVRDGATSGTTGRALRMEAVVIDLLNAVGGLRYRAHVQRKGWLSWVTGGQVAGTTGKALRIEALQLELTGAIAATHHIEYRVHVQGIGWQGWVRNGAIAGTTGRALRLEAIEIRLVRR